jgi:PKD domain/Thrombospondin type 3 repeat
MERTSQGDRWAFGRPHQPFVTPRKRRWSVAGAMTAALMIFATVALADSVDADSVDAEANVITLTAGSTLDLDIDVFLLRNGQATSSLTWGTPSKSGTGCGSVTVGAPSPGSLTFSDTAWASVPTGQSKNSRDHLTPARFSVSAISGTAGADGTSCTITFATSAHSPSNALAGSNNSAPITLRFVAPAVTDTDGDGVPDSSDNCPNDANPNQADTDLDGMGDECDSNAFVPAVETEADDVTDGVEGSPMSTNGAFSDADGNDTLTITKQSGAGTVTPGTDGAWSWSYTSADQGSGTVVVQASDGDLDHAVATDSFDWTAVNAAPTVVAGFSGASADCQTSATLNVDPDDLGVNDSPWKVNITWGDGNTESEITRTDLDEFQVNHVYALAGPYNATVSVTDKDGDSGSDNTNAITVNQTYGVDFLPPFDDSTPSGLIVNKMKNGRVVPVKVTLFDECGLSPVTDPSTAVTIKVSKTSGTGGAGDPVEEYADAGQSSAGTSAFRWSTDGFWIYNLDSKALGLVVNNYYRVDVYVGAVKATVDNWGVLQPVK